MFVAYRQAKADGIKNNRKLTMQLVVVYHQATADEVNIEKLIQQK